MEDAVGVAKGEADERRVEGGLQEAEGGELGQLEFRTADMSENVCGRWSPAVEGCIS